VKKSSTVTWLESRDGEAWSKYYHGHVKYDAGLDLEDYGTGAGGFFAIKSDMTEHCDSLHGACMELAYSSDLWWGQLPGDEKLRPPGIDPET
jgi:hypothetical protein